MPDPAARFALRYGVAIAVVATVILVMFGLAEAAHIDLLEDPRPHLDEAGAWFAAAAVALLIADVLLPVPASIVMVALGSRYGMVGGAALAMLGGGIGALLAFAIGRRGGARLDRLVSPAERAAFDRWFDRRGDVVVVVSRPVPILAETVAILAGTTLMTLPRFTLAVLLGMLPTALFHAAAGSAVGHLDNGLVLVSAVLVVGGAVAVWRTVRADRLPKRV